MRTPIAAFLVLALSPTLAHAWVRTPTCYVDRPGSVFECQEGETPIPIAWTESCVGYLLQQDGSADIGDLATVRDIANRAFNHWNQIDCANITVGEIGTTPSRAVGVPNGEPDANIIMFVSSGWRYPSAVQALTTVTYRITDGVIVDADMEYNEQVFNIGVVDSSDDNTILDLENVMTHEAGHFLGLDHVVMNDDFVDDGTGVEGATMFATAGLGETIKRSLAADDIAGVCDIYSEAPICVCTFSSGQIDESCAIAREPGDGCATTSSPTLPGLVLALGALFGLRRRRSA